MCPKIRKIFNFIIANRIYVLCIGYVFSCLFIASNCPNYQIGPVISFTNSSIFVKDLPKIYHNLLGIFGPVKSRPTIQFLVTPTIQWWFIINLYRFLCSLKTDIYKHIGPFLPLSTHAYSILPT